MILIIKGLAGSRGPYCKAITITSALVAFIGLIDSDYKSVVTSRNPFCQSITITLKTRTRPADKINSKFSKFITQSLFFNMAKSVLYGGKTGAQNYQKLNCTASKLLKCLFAQVVQLSFCASKRPHFYNPVVPLKKY